MIPLRRKVLLTLVAALVTSVTLIALLVVPLSQGFEFAMTPGLAHVGWQSESYPAGAHIEFSWQSEFGTPMHFLLVSPDGDTIYSDEYPDFTSNGSYGFTSMGGVYTFECNGNGTESIQVSGTITSPVL